MSTYEPGTVADITITRRKQPAETGEYRAFRVKNGWISSTHGFLTEDADTFDIDIRPLVVLDIKGDPAELVAHLKEATDGFSKAAHGMDAWSGRQPIRDITDQIEAQVAPPRIPEPGLWGVVEARRRELDGTTDLATGMWVRVDAAVCPWQHTSGNCTADWSDLIDPTLVRPGLGDES